jgi:plasmid maintenance system antidote protein VapI
MIGGSSQLAVIPTDILWDDYYANLHGSYNSMREGFTMSGLTQDDIACALNVDKSLISRRLNGSENLTLKTLSHMGSAMGCRLTVNFVPYSMVGVGNTYAATPSATFSVTSSGTNAPPPSARSGSTSILLENA